MQNYTKRSLLIQHRTDDGDIAMRRIVSGRLKNGLKVYSHYDSKTSSFLCGLGVKFGAAYDSTRGLAHMLEHMVFRSSKHYSVRDVLLMSHALFGGLGNWNVRTDLTSTFFGSPLLMRNRGGHDLQYILGLISDVIKNPVFSRQGLKVEKAAINQEICLDMDMPEETIRDKLLQVVYSKNPVRDSMIGTIGTPSRVRNMSLKLLRDYHRTYYVPNNMFMIVLGYPSHNMAMELAREYFSDLSPKKIPPRPRPFAPRPLLSAVKSKEFMRAGLHTNYFIMGFPTENFFSDDAVALDVIASILDFQLWNRLREDNRLFHQGSYRVFAENENSYLHGLFTIQFASESYEFIRTGERIVQEECLKLCRERIADDLLSASLKQCRFNYKEALSVLPEVLCEMIIKSVSNGDDNLGVLHNYGYNLDRVTRKKLRAVANKYFSLPYARVLLRPA